VTIKGRLKALEKGIPKPAPKFIVPRFITLRGEEAARARAEHDQGERVRTSGPVRLIRVIEPAEAGTE